MAFLDYTSLQKLALELGITHKRQRLFADVLPIKPTERLVED